MYSKNLYTKNIYENNGHSSKFYFYTLQFTFIILYTDVKTGLKNPSGAMYSTHPTIKMFLLFHFIKFTMFLEQGNFRTLRVI